MTLRFVLIHLLALLSTTCLAQYYSGTAPTIETIDISVSTSDLAELQDNSILEYPCSVTWQGTEYLGAKIELHGATARGFEKKSYRLTFDKTQIPPFEFNYDNYGEYPYRQLVLGASFIDASFMTNKLSMDVMLELGVLAPRITYAVVNFNGAYHGFYLVVERIGKEFIGSKGWNPDGNLYKAENHSANWQMKSDPLLGLDKKEGLSNPSTDIPAILTALKDTPRSFTEWETNVRPLFNLTDMYGYNMALTYAMGRDAYTKNYYLYNDVEDAMPMRYIAWDCDATWGISYDGSINNKTTEVSELWGKGSSQNEGLSSRLFAISGYQKSYLTKFYYELTQGSLTTEALLAKVEFMEAMMAEYIAQDTAKWSKYYFKGRLSWANAVSWIKTIITQRNAVLRAAISAQCSWDSCGVCDGDDSTCSSPVRVTEVMFSQTPRFVEIKNVGSRTVDLTGYEFTAGPLYRFAPGTTLGAGEHLVLVENSAEFSALFPNVIPHDTYVGHLSKDQTVTLVNVNLISVFSVHYSTQIPWPELTATCEGRSLVTASPNPSATAQADPLQWKWSNNVAGSPGMDDPLTGTPCQNYTAPTEATAATYDVVPTVATTGLPFTLDPTATEATATDSTPNTQEPSGFTLPADTRNNNNNEDSGSSGTRVAVTISVIVGALAALL